MTHRRSGLQKTSFMLALVLGYITTSVHTNGCRESKPVATFRGGIAMARDNAYKIGPHGRERSLIQSEQPPCSECFLHSSSLPRVS